MMSDRKWIVGYILLSAVAWLFLLVSVSIPISDACDWL